MDMHVFIWTILLVLCTGQVRAQADPCLEFPCMNQATCTSDANNTSYSCTCAGGYTGLKCETDIDECAGVQCQNGGTCNDEVNGYSCSCVPGYNGTHCENDIDECAGVQCQNGGTCNDEVNGYSCSCVPGYNGTHCENDIDECAGVQCQNGGTCNDEVNGYSCSCVPGYNGTHCENDIDECAGVQCQNGGTCNDEVNGYSCSCVPGYNGTHCENDIDECAGVQCQNGGTCNDEVNGYSCSCVPGYNGTHCENDIDECAGVQCQNGGTCNDEVNEYNCSCVSGYIGTHCEDVDPCALNPCRNGGLCAVAGSNFTCACGAEYFGNLCQIDMALVSETVERHNEYRMYHNVDPVTHNLDLSLKAQEWADHLGTTGSLMHSTFDWRKYNGQYTGENLAWAMVLPGSPPLDGKTATTNWYNEVLNYNYNDPGFNMDTGHFTQVAWSESKEVGVGRAQMENGAWIIVVHYFAVGNFGVTSDYVRNVQPYDFPPGSQCPLLTLTTDFTSNLFNIKKGDTTVYDIDLTKATQMNGGVGLEVTEDKVMIQHTKAEESYLVSRLCFWVRKVGGVKVQFLKQDLTTEILSEQFSGIESVKFTQHCLSSIPSSGMTANTVKFTITPLEHVQLMFFRFMEVTACAKAE